MTDADLFTALTLAAVSSGGPTDPENLMNYVQKVFIALKTKLATL